MSAVEIKFDANQQYQRDAIDGVVDLFAGQEVLAQRFTLPGLDDELALEGLEHLVFGNSLSLAAQTLQANLRRVQDRKVLTGSDGLGRAIPNNMRKVVEGSELPLDFSVEMETGTGKTYVYIRTIAELNQKYGFSKFIVIVPSIAIREGVLSSLQSLQTHIRDIYDGLQYDAYVYDSGALTRVRQFSTAPHLQIMVMNIDSFTKESNIINRSTDAMNGCAPIEFLRACRPVIVMDEPQNMETDIRRQAIDSLSPLFRLRYSATHRSLQHLVYRLTPVDAYDLRLVKRIGVLSITMDDDLNDAFVEIEKINSTPTGVTATAYIHKITVRGTKRTRITLRKDDDLFELSGSRDIYHGWFVEDIHSDRALVEFSNGRRVRAGSTTGEGEDQLLRLQVREAIRSHFEKELQLVRQLKRGVIPAAIKPLTLFFIDKVANYYPADGKIRVWFEDEYESVRNDPKYRSLDMPSVAEVHDGYFATSANGVPKDTRAGQDTKDASDAFERIMKNKEKLLSFDEPLRFIFSHSALSEGWDNPNVFTICNLQDGRSEMRKRQQVGRGLRLPVMSNGERCRVDEINLLTVIASDSFSNFAADLQHEIEEETGVTFDKRIIDLKKDKVKLGLKPELLDSSLFQELWSRIAQRTTYDLEFVTSDVEEESLKRINSMANLEPIRFRMQKSELEMSKSGLLAKDTRGRGAVDVIGVQKLPDCVAELCRRVPLSRSTIVRILRGCDKLDQIAVNPSVFIDRAADAMNRAVYSQVAAGISYHPIDGEMWDANRFVDAHQEETVASIVVEVSKSITDRIVCDSEVEEAFANYLEDHPQVRLFLKLPGWFVIPTPLGNYNPDWAVVVEESEGQYAYLVRETKGGDDIEKLRFESEGWKIQCGDAHFRALNVDYAFGHDPAVLIDPVGYKAATHRLS
jgi:type III restriction enzyme